MRYDRDIKTVREILKSVDINNTLNGGRSEPQTSIKKLDNYYLLEAKVPGVEVDQLRVEIIDGKVIIHHPMAFEQALGDLTVPQVVAAFPITPKIDHKNITAHRIGNKVEVIMPFNELADGYNRNIDISY